MNVLSIYEGDVCMYCFVSTLKCMDLSVLQWDALSNCDARGRGSLKTGRYSFTRIWFVLMACKLWHYFRSLLGSFVTRITGDSLRD